MMKRTNLSAIQFAVAFFLGMPGIAGASLTILGPNDSSYSIQGPQAGQVAVNGQAYTSTNSTTDPNGQSYTVGGSFIANLTAPPKGSKVTQGASVTTGTVMITDHNSFGFANGVGVQGEATLTQTLLIVGKNPNDNTTQVSFSANVGGLAEVQAADNPKYTDVTGSSFYISADNASANAALIVGEGNQKQTFSSFAHDTNGDTSGAAFSDVEPFNLTGTKQQFTFTAGSKIPIQIFVSIASGGVFSGSDLAMVDPTFTLDPQFQNDFTLELSPFPADLTNVSTVPKVQPLVLIGALCLFGFAFGRRLEVHRTRS
jgi:hypothetical protein